MKVFDGCFEIEGLLCHRFEMTLAYSHSMVAGGFEEMS
jgi:hypothetical protein